MTLLIWHYRNLSCWITNFLIVAILGGLNLPCQSKTVHQDALAKQAIWVGFCELYRTPEKFDGRLIRTKAILVATIEPVLDGGDSFLFSRKCGNASIMCTYGYSEPPSSKLGEKLKKLFFSSKKGSQGRAEVMLQGTFEIAKEHGFGHLSVYKYRIDLAKIESARRSK